ncbi:hypothetical protein [Metabacillus endolithicus]|uniref:Uncharacterized protein n=1 Tax=Metabacillus endolithicus TaxID=1535204 RepID=A0ABW5BPT4_9BACI|nr:hypothetical protein [Metabacillus endolithicus]UPG63815.1 hypothetical protein MVE64_01195 [Metabacillus endolithicus]
MKSEVIKFYENREDVTLTTYVISDSPELLGGKKRPAILISVPAEPTFHVLIEKEKQWH